jgi:hypothetical protein
MRPVAYVMLLAVVPGLVAGGLITGSAKPFYVLLLIFLFLVLWFRPRLARLFAWAVDTLVCAFILLVAWPFRAWKRGQQGER